MGDEELDECLKGCDVVAIPAGVPRKPGGLQLKHTNSLQVLHVYLAPKRVDHFIHCGQYKYNFLRDD